MKSLPRAARKLRIRLAIIIFCVALAPTLLNSISAANSSLNTPTSNNHTAPNQASNAGTVPTKSGGDLKSATAGKTNTNVARATNTEQQQSQSTDLSSMYVQIPIADPSDAGMQDGALSTDSESAGDQADSKTSSWSGPWPKKFQIGYIKQSDLHQVLIESLKNDPFVSLGSAQTIKPGPTSTPSPSANSKAPLSKVASALPESPTPLKSNQWQQSATHSQQQQIARPQHLMNNNAMYQHQFGQLGAQNFREPKMMQQGHRFHQVPFNQPPRTPKAGFMQQQFQFAGIQSNVFKNQPMYTINYPHQEQLDMNSMQLIVPQQPQFVGPMSVVGQTSPARPQKSSEYYSSWKPVTSDKSEQTIVGSRPTGGAFQTDYQSLNDGFDDGFNSPSKDAVAGSGSMNRHPALNNYLGVSNGEQSETGSGGKMSPAMVSAAKMRQHNQQEPSKTGRGTKSSVADSGAVKGGAQSVKGSGPSDSSMNLSVNRRRIQNGTSTSTVSTISDPPSTSTTTTSSTSSTTLATTNPEGSNATTSAPPTPSTTSASTIMTTTIESDTSEPDSEVIDADTTEPAAAQSTTAAPSSTASDQQQVDVSSTTSTLAPAEQANNGQQDNGDTEVVTQGLGQPSSVTGSGTASSTQASTAQPSSTVASTREETTPTSDASSVGTVPAATAVGEAQSSSGETKGEIEGPRESTSKGSVSKAQETMSDEALLTAAVRTGSEIGKMNGVGAPQSQMAQSLQRQRPSTGTSTSTAASTNTSSTTTSTSSSSSSSKRTRSSERLVQPKQTQSSSPGRKQQVASKQATKKAASVASGNRTGKQVGGTAEASSLKATTRNGSSNRQQLIGGAGASKKRPLSQKVGKSSAPGKATRMVQQSDRLQQQQPQIVSMTASQAQSTAQTLASLLLSRCLTSSNCAHLLEICTTKQALIPLLTSGQDSSQGSNLVQGDSPGSKNNSAAAWSMPVGLMSTSIMGLIQALQADRALKLFPQWKDTIENIVDHDTQSGYTLILPSNEAIDRLPLATIESWLANQDLMSQIIENHLLDSAESIEFSANGRSQSRLIRSKSLQINQHRDKMVTINGKRLVYANQVGPCK